MQVTQVGVLKYFFRMAYNRGDSWLVVPILPAHQAALTLWNHEGVEVHH